MHMRIRCTRWHRTERVSMLFMFADAWQRCNRGVVMAQVGNNEDRFGGEFMIQDSDHMSGIRAVTDKASPWRRAPG